MFHKAPHLYKHITFADIGGFRRNLAQIYSILQQYEKALDNIKEALFIYKKSIERSSILPESELRIEEGNILLRMNRLKEADVILTEAIDVRDRLENPDCTLRAFIALSEISIILGNLKKAIIYCNRAINEVYNRDGNSPMLLDSNCYYNMAIVLYKQRKYTESVRYFSKVFELLNRMCKNFLDKKVYKKLLGENAFEIIKDESQIKTCLQNSLKIFSAIYGENHSFVKNYVSKID